MRSLPFPRRLQLVKLLRAHGLRDAERLREDELKEALARLSILLPDVTGPGGETFAPAPAALSSTSSLSSSQSASSSNMGGGQRAVVVALDLDADDPHALPRFLEPKLFLPDSERTFLRCIAVKARHLYLTWDLHKELPRDRPAQLLVFVRDHLGDPPAVADVLAQHPSFVVDVDAAAPGWYVQIPGERQAVAAALVVDGVRVADSNLAIMPAARAAPPGPLWEATLLPGTSRRALRKGGLLGANLPEGATVVVKGEAHRQDGGMFDLDTDPSSGSSASSLWMRAQASSALPTTNSNPAGNPSSPSSSSSMSSSSLASSLSSGASAGRHS